VLNAGLDSESSSLHQQLTPNFVADTHVDDDLMLTISDYYGVSVDTLTSHKNLTGKAYSKKQTQLARLLFELGMKADPQHGPLYHAYGNMEQVYM